jgi:hypothetical protein
VSVLAGIKHSAQPDLYPTGDYKTEIYLNGELAKTVEFKIE